MLTKASDVICSLTFLVEREKKGKVLVTHTGNCSHKKCRKNELRNPLSLFIYIGAPSYRIVGIGHLYKNHGVLMLPLLDFFAFLLDCCAAVLR